MRLNNDHPLSLSTRLNILWRYSFHVLGRVGHVVRIIAISVTTRRLVDCCCRGISSAASYFCMGGLMPSVTCICSPSSAPMYFFSFTRSIAPPLNAILDLAPATSYSSFVRREIQRTHFNDRCHCWLLSIQAIHISGTPCCCAASRSSAMSPPSLCRLIVGLVFLRATGRVCWRVLRSPPLPSTSCSPTP